MFKSCRSLAHLSLFKVVKDVLCILWTHVAVLRVLWVDVKLLWDLYKWRQWIKREKCLYMPEESLQALFSLLLVSEGVLALLGQQGVQQQQLRAPLLQLLNPLVPPLLSPPLPQSFLSLQLCLLSSQTCSRSISNEKLNNGRKNWSQVVWTVKGVRVIFTSLGCLDSLPALRSSLFSSLVSSLLPFSSLECRDEPYGPVIKVKFRLLIFLNHELCHKNQTIIQHVITLWTA